MTLNIDIHTFNTYIKSPTGQTEWIHTVKCGDDKLDALVCLHGYGGTSLTYYKMMKPLSKSYKVYCLDIIGTGLSSRPEFKTKDPNQIVEYFCSILEEWRKFFNIQQFYLAGHSFGGFLAAQYAIKYPQNIKQLILISPVGVRRVSEQENTQLEQEIYNNAGIVKKWFLRRVKNCYNEGKGISQMYQSFIIPSGYFLNKYLNNRLSLPQAEQQLWKDYMDSVLSLPASFERGFNFLFKLPKLAPALPLEDDLQKLPFLVNFFYGEDDWMERSTAYKLINDKKIKGNYKEIVKADHQIVFQNPEDLSQEICLLLKQ